MYDNWSRSFGWSKVILKLALFSQLVHGSRQSIFTGQMHHWMVAHKDHIVLSVAVQPLIVIGILLQGIYYSTHNGIVWCELSFLSGSWMYNRYYGQKLILKTAHFFGFKWVSIRISTEWHDLVAISNQITFFDIVIGIFVYCTRYAVELMIYDVSSVLYLARMFLNHMCWEMKKFSSHIQFAW